MVSSTIETFGRLDVLYNNALRDYNAGKYDLSSQEFNDYLKYYGTTDLAGNAQFYVADIEYRQGNFEAAVRDYDKVLEQYPSGNKAAANAFIKQVLGKAGQKVLLKYGFLPRVKPKPRQ